MQILKQVGDHQAGRTAHEPAWPENGPRIKTSIHWLGTVQ